MLARVSGGEIWGSIEGEIVLLLNRFFRPASPTPGPVQQEGTPGCYGEPNLLHTSLFTKDKSLAAFA